MSRNTGTSVDVHACVCVCVWFQLIFIVLGYVIELVWDKFITLVLFVKVVKISWDKANEFTILRNNTSVFSPKLHSNWFYYKLIIFL